MWVYKDEYDSKKKYEYKPQTVAKPILQYTTKGEFIKEWASAKEAHLKLGVQRGTLSSALKGNYQTCGGYAWRFKIADEIPHKVEIPEKEIHISKNRSIDITW